MRKFFGEFKKFITRGNVVDMAVGVIVGSSFTAIVNGLSNNVLKPIINWLLTLAFGEDSLTEIYTFLVRADADGNPIGKDQIPDLKQSIYIDWGAFINAVINFFLVAFVLFVIVRIVNKARENNREFAENIRKLKPTKADRKEMKARGIRLIDRDAVEEYYKEKEALALEKKKAEEAAAQEKARLDRLANPTTEDLLKEIRDLLKLPRAYFFSIKRKTVPEALTYKCVCDTIDKI